MYGAYGLSVSENIPPPPDRPQTQSIFRMISGLIPRRGLGELLERSFAQLREVHLAKCLARCPFQMAIKKTSDAQKWGI